MKKILSILVCVLLICGLFAACNNASPVASEADTQLASISFEEMVSETKALSATIMGAGEIEEQYWFYTAVKTDGGPASGSTGTTHDKDDKVAVSAGEKGIKGKVVSGFSAGEWTFMLYGYNNADGSDDGSDKKQLYQPPADYEGAPATVTASMVTTVKVLVELMNTEGTDGYLTLKDITVPEGSGSTTTVAYRYKESSALAFSNWVALTGEGVAPVKYSLKDSTVSPKDYKKLTNGTYLVNVGVFYDDTIMTGEPECEGSIVVGIFGSGVASDKPKTWTEINGSIDDLTGGVIFDPITGGFMVTYDANGATSGIVPKDYTAYKLDAIVTVKGNEGYLAKTGCTFAGWNTKADGSGTAYDEGNTFPIEGDTTLYAQWSSTAKVTYYGNGATSGAAPIDNTIYQPGDTVTVKGNTGKLIRTDYGFYGWNTKADGTGVSYQVGEKFVIDKDTILYAEWGIIPKVGGKIFYIDNNAVGKTYKFYDSSMAEITDQSVSGLATAKYYEVTGGSSDKDKFYVYDTTMGNGGLVENKEWGASGTEVGSGSFTNGSESPYLPSAGDGNKAPRLTAIGAGKLNTDECLRKTDATTYAHPLVFKAGEEPKEGDQDGATVWTWIRDVRDESKAGTGGDKSGNTTGLYDWFIPSTDELEKLRLSNLVSAWFDESSGSLIWTSVEYDSDIAYYWACGGSRWYSNDKYGSNYVVAMRAF